MNVSRAEKRLDDSINAKNDSNSIVRVHRNKSGGPLSGTEGIQMRTLTIGLLVLAAASLLATSFVVAHDTDTGENASDTERAEWMEEHMAEQLGEEQAANMRERMGMSYEEMGEMMHDGRVDDMGCH